MRSDTQLQKHALAGTDHHRRTTQIIFRSMHVWVCGEIFLKQHLMDKANVSVPVVPRERRRQGQVEFEIWVRLLGES